MLSALSSRLPRAAPLVAVTLAYFASASLALHAFGEVTPLWYSNAFVVVALLHQPLRTWPVYIAAAWLADAVALLLFGVGGSIVVTVADVLEILLAAGMLHWTGGIREPLFERKQVARVMLTCVLAPVASAFLGGALLSSVLEVDFEQAVRNWYSASALGLVIVLPFLLSWLDPMLRANAFDRVHPRDVVLLAIGALVLAWLPQRESHHEFLFLTFPILFAMTWAYGLGGASVGMVVVLLSAIQATLTGHGAIVAIVFPVTAVAERIETLQVYLAAMLLSSLPLALLHAQQRRLAENLRRTGEARAEFLAAMSHEIRTPMTGVLGMMDLLSHEHLSARQQSYVDAMRSSGRHLLSIINDILDYSRIESGRIELEEVDFSMCDVLERLRSLAHPLAVERGLALRLDNRCASDVLRGDPLRLRQVLLNLVSNAIKFTDQGSVTLSVTQRPAPEGDGVRVHFAVSDTGVGIEADKLEHLFAPFTQADRSIARQYGGSGLGLAISKRLVEAMGGRLGATSTPGEGSVFSFEVPLPLGDSQQLEAEERAQHVTSAPRRILVAEDVDINREILRTALARHGHQVAFAKDGAEALAMVQQQPFDVVLMDVQMPVMDGVEATRRIRKLPGPVSTVPILGLTANVMARERERYLGAGMDACLPKPIDWDRLHAAIAQYASGAQVPPTRAPSAAPPGLIDEDALEAMRKLTGDDLPGLIHAGMRGYEESCERMFDPQATAELVHRDAHKLKGSSGTLGLAAICRIAGCIEEAAGQGELPRHLMPQLREAITATRAELVRRGVLAAPEHGRT